MGPRHLDELLDDIGSFGTQDPAMGRAEIAAPWRAGRAEYERLAVSEAGVADDAEIKPMPRRMASHVARLVADSGIRRTFDTVPVAFGMVELEKLVISQYSLTRSVVDRIRDAHPLPLSPQRLAELCLPLNPMVADFRLAGQSGREFTFVSDAHDMRFLDATVLEPDATPHLDVMGQPRAVVALSVGFSSNLLNAVRYNGRVVLNNGHHRAYALRAMGLTHAPCLIQPCASMEDVGQAATGEVRANADLYFESPRPPLLSDFDRPTLTHAFQAPQRRRQLILTIDVQSRLLAL